MAKNYLMKFKVTKRQQEAIQFNAERAGYRFTAHFLRDLALNHSFSQKQMIEEMYRKLIKDDQTGKNPRMD